MTQVVLRTVREAVGQAFERERFKRWGTGMPRGFTTDKPTGLDRVNENLRCLDDALASLGKRDRAGARAWLEARKRDIEAARAAYLSVKEDFSGERIRDLAGRIEAARVDVSKAQTALMNAPADRKAIAELRADLDLASAKARELDRELAALCKAADLPEESLIDPAVFARAKGDTQALARLAASAPRTVAMHAALDQGAGIATAATSSAAAKQSSLDLEARLWICFESNRARHDVFALRWERYCDLRGVVSEATAAE
jgi:hypothetical protein